MTQAEFEEKFHRKHVRVSYPNTEVYEGVTTAALLHGHGDIPIIAVLGPGGMAAADWRTYQLEPDLSDLQFFTVLGDWT